MMHRMLVASLAVVTALLAGAAHVRAEPPDNPLRAPDQPPTDELPLLPAEGAAGATAAAVLCRNDRGNVFCETDNRNGLFLDVHPHAPAVGFQLDVYLSECGLPGVPYKARHEIFQEARRVTWYRYNQATPVHWNWRPVRPCWQVWFVDCTVDGRTRSCHEVLQVKPFLAG